MTHSRDITCFLGSYIPPFGRDITAQKACYIPPTRHLTNTYIVLVDRFQACFFFKKNYILKGKCGNDFFLTEFEPGPGQSPKASRPIPGPSTNFFWTVLGPAGWHKAHARPMDEVNIPAWPGPWALGKAGLGPKPSPYIIPLIALILMVEILVNMINWYLESLIDW